MIFIPQRFSVRLEGPFKAGNLETFILPLPGTNQCSHFLQNKLCRVDSRGTKRKDSWELLAFPFLFCARLQMKMCWKRCKSWVPQGRNCDILESHISPPRSSMPMTLLLITIWVPVLQFCPTPGVIIDARFFYFLLLFFSLTIAATTCCTALLASPARRYLQF